VKYFRPYKWIFWFLYNILIIVVKKSELFFNLLQGVKKSWRLKKTKITVITDTLGLIHLIVSYLLTVKCHKPHHHTPQPFYGLFSGPPGSAGARRELLDFMVQGKINRGRHTDRPAGCHSIQTNQCPPPPSPHFLQAGCPSCCPTNSVKALKAN